ncbi:MAG: M3 family metallopeptidase [Bacteroidales bacterium]|nr:M3 family metallopeptidase [Bacteroidales bacterium]
MKKLFFVLLPALIMTVACNETGKKKEMVKENPFLVEYTTPQGVPPFNTIEVTHYMPAFAEGMKQQNAVIDAIVNNSEESNFENTILAYDKSDELLTKVSNVFFNVLEANTNEEMQAVAREITPMLSNHGDNISLNEGLFKKVKRVYQKRNEMNLKPEQIRVIEKYYNDFVRSGANLEGADRETLKEINSEISMLTLKFGENVLKETNNFKMFITDQKDLAGLPEGVISAAAEAAEAAEADNAQGQWLFTVQKPSMIPFLQYAENRDLREKLYMGYVNRANNNNEFDNKVIISKLVPLRARKAQLLGYDNYAAYRLEINMAQNPENVYEFLNGLWEKALPVAKKELKEMQAIADKDGAKFKLESWDWWFYAEKLRKQKYDLDENEIIPYFSLENVRNGIFHVSEKLYGITFKKLENMPVYHKDVDVYEVFEADGSHLGLMYLDMHPRASKRGGAWCTSLRSSTYKDGVRVPTHSSIVCNFTPPTGDKPALLNFDEVTTFFHEFGHGLHGLFSDGPYTRTSGSVPRDFVELPSQIMENWASEPEVLKVYAKHYQTGEVIPDELIQKIQNSGNFNQGFTTVEYLAAALLDMEYHMVSDGKDIDVAKFEQEKMDKLGLIPEIYSRYRSTYFGHIFAGGYASGYYVYIWAGVLDADAFDAFKQSGDLYNQDLAAKFRENCLQKVGDGESMDQYIKFRGQKPTDAALLKRRGLN